MAGYVFPMGPESFKRFTPDSLAAIEQRMAQEEARRKKQYQEVRMDPPGARLGQHPPGNINQKWKQEVTS